MKRRGFLLIVVLSLTSFVFGQNDPPAPPPAAKPPSTISGGVLNGKATSLPKPAYPAAARAVNAEGAVSVQVLIDEQGTVISASAVSGHPLLRAAATEAARGAQFSPTLLQGQPVKVSGVITYNFVGTVTMASIGYELAFAERSGSFTPYVMPKSLAARLPDDWTEEKEALETIEFEKPVVTTTADVQKAKNPNVYTVKGDVNYSASASPYKTEKLTIASIESLRRLQVTMRSKLAGDPKNDWHFRVGTTLGNFAAEIADNNKTSFNVAEIEQLVGTAPAGTNQNVITALTKLVELAKTHDGSPEARQMLVVAAQNVKNIRP